MDDTAAGVAIIGKNFHTNPLCIWSNTDIGSTVVAAQCQSSHFCAMPGIVIGEQGMFIVRVEPTVRSSPPARRYIGVIHVDAGIHKGQGNALTSVTKRPYPRGIEQAD